MPTKHKPLKLQPRISKAQLQKRIVQLGQQISRDYRGKDLLCVGVLKGAVPFFVALTQQIKLDIDQDFVCVASYHGGRQSSGKIKWVMDLIRPIKGRHVLLIEDIIDSGLTMQVLLKTLRRRRPASIKIATLLSKPAARQHKVKPDYCGFEIGNEFVVGFGLDYFERYRNLDYVATL